MNWFTNLDSSSLLLIVLAIISIKAAVLAAFIWLGLKLMRIRGASARHQAATLVLYGMLLMPALIFFIPAIPLPEVAVMPEFEQESASTTLTDHDEKSEIMPQSTSSSNQKTDAQPQQASMEGSIVHSTIPLKTTAAGRTDAESSTAQSGNESAISPMQFAVALYTWSKVKLPGDPRGRMSMASHRGDLFSNAEGQFEFDGFLNGIRVIVIHLHAGFPHRICPAMLCGRFSH